MPLYEEVRGRLKSTPICEFFFVWRYGFARIQFGGYQTPRPTVGSGGMSSRAAAARGEVLPPLYRCDRQRRSLSRTDPTGRGKPARVHENVRVAMPVGDLQGDVFFKGRTFDRFPSMTFPRRPHRAFSQVRTIASVSAAFAFNPKPAVITSAPLEVPPSLGCSDSSP
jgi:hypothetical protein